MNSDIDNDERVVKYLAYVARHSGSIESLKLAAQIFGVAPCEHCHFIKKYCRCDKILK